MKEQLIKKRNKIIMNPMDNQHFKRVVAVFLSLLLLVSEAIIEG
jgi:hypothetical protein